MPCEDLSDLREIRKADLRSVVVCQVCPRHHSSVRLAKLPRYKSCVYCRAPWDLDVLPRRRRQLARLLCAGCDESAIPLPVLAEEEVSDMLVQMEEMKSFFGGQATPPWASSLPAAQGSTPPVSPRLPSPSTICNTS